MATAAISRFAPSWSAAPSWRTAPSWHAAALRITDLLAGRRDEAGEGAAGRGGGGNGGGGGKPTPHVPRPNHQLQL